MSFYTLSRYQVTDIRKKARKTILYDGGISLYKIMLKKSVLCAQESIKLLIKQERLYFAQRYKV